MSVCPLAYLNKSPLPLTDPRDAVPQACPAVLYTDVSQCG